MLERKRNFTDNQWRSQEFYRAWTKKILQNVTSFLRIISHFLQIISHFLRIISHFLRIYLSCGSFNPTITSPRNLNLWQNLQEMCFLRNLPKNPQEKLKILVMARLATKKVGAEPGH